MAGKKLSLTNNPLGKPSTSIQALALEFQDFMHFPDPAPLYAVMGAVAANMLTGNPVWLMLIGPPSCGKTTLLETLLGIPGTHSISSLSGEAALLSAVPKKDRSTGSTGGLLRAIGEHGALILKDFTSMMAKQKNELDEIISALREIYDGHWDRGVGSEGGRVITWDGKLAILSGCTGVIDHHHQISNEMGERWIYFRYPETDGFGETNRALSVTDPPAEVKARMRELVKCFFLAMGITWGADIPKRQFTAQEKARLIAVATFAARARSGVPRNAWSREVEDSPQYEAPARLASVLGQLYLGMEFIGLEEEERWRVVGKIAGDCMPQLRLRAFHTVKAGVGQGPPVNGHASPRHDVEFNTEQMKEVLQCSRSTTNRVLEDLCLLDVFRQVQGKKMWVLSPWAKGEWENGWGTIS